ncbi:hypothetical protein BLOT_015788 [Blomia tropicalis]|nr:hypothetical protein BLOT_015788 [Blomia tropicalis]
METSYLVRLVNHGQDISVQRSHLPLFSRMVYCCDPVLCIYVPVAIAFIVYCAWLITKNNSVDAVVVGDQA